MSSLRFEDLKEELVSLKNRISIKLKQGITESILERIFYEGDEIIKELREELISIPINTKQIYTNIFAEQLNQWNTFKINCKTNPSLIIGGPSIKFKDDVESTSQNQFEVKLNLIKGIQILEQTTNSLRNASKVAQESEQIGTNVLNELGGQKEVLIRTRGRLDDVNQSLKRGHRILFFINSRLLSNNFCLYIIILIELLITALLIYWKYFKK